MAPPTRIVLTIEYDTDGLPLMVQLRRLTAELRRHGYRLVGFIDLRKAERRAQPYVVGGRRRDG